MSKFRFCFVSFSNSDDNDNDANDNRKSCCLCMLVCWYIDAPLHHIGAAINSHLFIRFKNAFYDFIFAYTQFLYRCTDFFFSLLRIASYSTIPSAKWFVCLFVRSIDSRAGNATHIKLNFRLSLRWKSQCNAAKFQRKKVNGDGDSSQGVDEFDSNWLKIVQSEIRFAIDFMAKWIFFFQRMAFFLRVTRKQEKRKTHHL